MPKIKANELSTGDRVYFPRLGWRRITKIGGIDGVFIKLVFDDRKTRWFETTDLVEAELRTDELVPLPGEIIRIDRETNRASLVSPSFHGFQSEISESFKPFRRVHGLMDSAALAEVRAGATLFTKKAIYFMPRDAARFP